MGHGAGVPEAAEADGAEARVALTSKTAANVTPSAMAASKYK